jgi:hypothetical protein
MKYSFYANKPSFGGFLHGSFTPSPNPFPREGEIFAAAPQQAGASPRTPREMFPQKTSSCSQLKSPQKRYPQNPSPKKYIILPQTLDFK